MFRDNFDDVSSSCSLLLNEESKIAYTVNRNDPYLIAKCEYSVDPSEIARHNFTEAVYLKQAVISKELGLLFLESTSKLKLNVPVFFARVYEIGGFQRIFYNQKAIKECVGDLFMKEFTFDYQTYYEEYLLPLEKSPDFTDTAMLINIQYMP
jgi:hypothetical protein